MKGTHIENQLFRLKYVQNGKTYTFFQLFLFSIFWGLLQELEPYNIVSWLLTLFLLSFSIPLRSNCIKEKQKGGTFD